MNQNLSNSVTVVLEVKFLLLKTYTTETGRLGIQGQPEMHGKTLASKNQNKEKKERQGEREEKEERERKRRRRKGGKKNGEDRHIQINSVSFQLKRKKKKKEQIYSKLHIKTRRNHYRPYNHPEQTNVHI